MNKFNIRVYGLLLNDRNEVLVSDENRHGLSFTKFPGGGLDWGEGIIDGLKREFLEELKINIDVHKLFYLTDFFIQSAFHEDDQLISVYYLVSYENWEEIPVNKDLKFVTDNESHRWLSLTTITENDFTFPIDKIVSNKLKLTHSN